MKRRIVLLLAILALLLVACQVIPPQDDPTDPPPTNPTYYTFYIDPTDPPPTDPTDPPHTDPTDPPPTDPPPTDPPPTDPPSPDPPPAEQDLINELTALFEDTDSWYYRLLLCTYDAPHHIDLKELFYNGFPDESTVPTDEEWAELKNLPGFNGEGYLIRLPMDKMNQVLCDHLGLGIENFIPDRIGELVYLNSTRCFYFMRSDMDPPAPEDFRIVKIEAADWPVRMYYTIGDGAVYEAVLNYWGKPYAVVSNGPKEPGNENR